MKAGDVAIAILPQAGGIWKPRPVVVLCAMPPFGDWLVCGVSTQLRHEVVGFDEVLTTTERDFVSSGLKSDSLIRLGFLLALPQQEIAGRIGEISSARHQRLLRNLANHLVSFHVP